jgi:hypothetical protein
MADRAQSIAGDLITNTMRARPTAGHYRGNGRPLLNGPRSGLPGGLPLPFSTVSRFVGCGLAAQLLHALSSKLLHPCPYGREVVSSTGRAISLCLFHADPRRPRGL